MKSKHIIRHFCNFPRSDYLCFLFVTFLILFFIAPAYATPADNSADFNGDKKDEIVLWSPVNGAFQALSGSVTLFSKTCGKSGDIPLLGDIDGDGVTEFVTWRAGVVTDPLVDSGSILVCKPGQNNVRTTLGNAGDRVFLTTDYDGDEISDPSFFRPRNGKWYKSLSQREEVVVTKNGRLGDIPVPSDYDGDGRTDETVFRPATGTWHLLFSSNRTKQTIAWGNPADIPVPADYDGDQKADIAVYRPEEGRWLIRKSSDLLTTLQMSLGKPGDRPYPLDQNADGKADIAVFRQSANAFYFKTSITAQTKGTALPKGHFLLPNEFRRPIKAINDYTGDGVSEFIVLRAIGANLAWLIADKKQGPLPTVMWGLRGDRSMFRDFTGDNRGDFVVIRNIGGLLYWFVRPSEVSSAVITKAFGAAGDTLIPEDYDSDEKIDFAVVRKAANNSLLWIIQGSSTNQLIQQPWGLLGDRVVVGDFNGDKQAELTVVRPIQGFLYWFSFDLNSRSALPQVQWGLSGDTLLPYDYDGDGRTDYGVSKLFGAQLFLFIRLATGETLDPIPWGLSGDQYVPAHYRGGYKVFPTVWRMTPGKASYFVTEGSLGAYEFPWGLKGDAPVSSNNAPTPPH